jgi:hypothetical protein
LSSTDSTNATTDHLFATSNNITSNLCTANHDEIQLHARFERPSMPC